MVKNANLVESKPPHDRLISLTEVIHKTSLAKSTIYREVSGGRFPKPVPASAGRSAWVESEVDKWIADTIANARN